MTTLHDGEIWVHYRFIHLSTGEPTPLGTSTSGQANGLCGAQDPGQLSFLTGLHTGRVRFAIEWSETEPPVDDVWEDVVEVPFDIPQPNLMLTAFDDWVEVEIPSQGSHRARFNAVGMDEGNTLDTAAGVTAPDRYLLQLWPAPHRPDEVIRQTSTIARIRHEHARA